MSININDSFMDNIFRIIYDDKLQKKNIFIFIGVCFLRDVFSNTTKMFSQKDFWIFLKKSIINCFIYIKKYIRIIYFTYYIIIEKIKKISIINLAYKKRKKNILIEQNTSFISKKGHVTFKILQNDWEALLSLSDIQFIKSPTIYCDVKSKDEMYIIEEYSSIKIQNESLKAQLNGSITTHWKYYREIDEKILDNIAYNENITSININYVSDLMDCIPYEEFKIELDKIFHNKHETINCFYKFNSINVSVHSCNIIKFYSVDSDYVDHKISKEINNLIYQLFYSHPKKQEILKKIPVILKQQILFLLLLSYDSRLQNIKESSNIPYIQYQGIIFGQKINITMTNIVYEISHNHCYPQEKIHSLFLAIDNIPYVDCARNMLFQKVNITVKDISEKNIIIKTSSDNIDKVNKHTDQYPFFININMNMNTMTDFNSLCIQKWNNLLQKAHQQYLYIKNEKKAKTINLEKKKSTQIKVYIIYEENENVQKEIENIEYNVYLKNKESFKIPPTKTCIKNEIQPVIKKDYVKHIRRDLSTIFLKHEDKEKIINVLLNFKNNMHILQNLGIPNKLGILLHGLPGTGKTSIISAIATYLEKDIYYLNLRTIESNDSLGRIFHHIFKETTNGGIIVMEDIDAMTNIVHTRKNTQIYQSNDNSTKKEDNEEEKLLKYKKENDMTIIEIPDTLKKFVERSEKTLEYFVNQNTNLKKQISQIQKSYSKQKNDNQSTLTLEYILNILQGSLTLDGTIFIATTNHFHKLDPAFVRDGRFDCTIELSYCVTEQLNELFYTFFNEYIDQRVLSLFSSNKWITSSIFVHLSKYIFTYKDKKFEEKNASQDMKNIFYAIDLWKNEKEEIKNKCKTQFYIMFPFLSFEKH